MAEIEILGINGLLKNAAKGRNRRLPFVGAPAVAFVSAERDLEFVIRAGVQVEGIAREDVQSANPSLCGPQVGQGQYGGLRESESRVQQRRIDLRLRLQRNAGNPGLAHTIPVL